MTAPTSGLSRPMPKATVAQTTRILLFKNMAWVRLRSAAGLPAW